MLVRPTAAAFLQSSLPTQNGTPFGAPSGGQLFIRWILAQSARASVALALCVNNDFVGRAPSREPPLIRYFFNHLCPRKTAPRLGRRLVEVEASPRLGKSQRRPLFAFSLPFRCGLLVRPTVAAFLQSPLPTQNGAPFGTPSGGQRWIRTTEVCDVRFTV